MKNKHNFTLKIATAFLLLGIMMISCSENDDSTTEKETATCTDGIQNGDETGIDCGGSCSTCEEENAEDPRPLTIAISVSSTGNAKVYTQTLTDLSTGSISFDGYGFEVPSTRTARIFSSDDGNSLYDLDYGGGRVYKFSVDGGQDFTQLVEKNIEYAMGTTNPRWTKMSNDYASLHNADSRNKEVVYEYETNEAGDTISSTLTSINVNLRIMSLNLDNLEIGTVEQFVMPFWENDSGTYNYVGRVDAPVIAGDKAYYGLSQSGYDPQDPEARTSAVYSDAKTLVVDYPSLTNPTYISTNVGNARGNTNGYRTPVAHLDEKGDVYQIITVSDNTYDTHILKITNGEYDESFDFNLSQLLGLNTKSNGWFYAGNGIGYVPFANTDIDDDNNWSVARVDLYNNTAVKLNVPENLWLQQYQNGVVQDGKFYMAITPTGETGNVYIFDIASDSADGFTVGAELENIADATYIGIY